MYLFMYVCMYVSMYVCIYVCIYLSIYLPIYLSIYLSIYLYIYLLYTYIHVYVCMYVCMYIHFDTNACDLNSRLRCFSEHAGPGRDGLSESLGPARGVVTVMPRAVRVRRRPGPGARAGRVSRPGAGESRSPTPPDSIRDIEP
jgi:hypothetical protein